MRFQHCTLPCAWMRQMRRVTVKFARCCGRSMCLSLRVESSTIYLYNTLRCISSLVMECALSGRGSSMVWNDRLKHAMLRDIFHFTLRDDWSVLRTYHRHSPDVSKHGEEVRLGVREINPIRQWRTCNIARGLII